MRKILLCAILLAQSILVFAQQKSTSAAEVYQEIEKLAVFGKVLYIAAHPDDENTRLLAYLANERKLETAYLSITRGDGGQNLIGDEQGIDLGLIRTQELLAARRIDGAKQFFTTAFDFGFSKSPEEALQIWGHDKILADVVWIIRNFRPDVIITRFPTTGEGGHGHHTASAILAGEAFEAAADSTKFPEQLIFVKAWQAKRLLWNTFNFGGNNTTRSDQLKLDVGVYNPVLGKSYGEIASESRSQHKSQGFGNAAQRGSVIEYFSLIKGEPVVSDIMDGVEVSSKKVSSSVGTKNVKTGNLSSNVPVPLDAIKYDNTVRKLISKFDIKNPSISAEDAKVLLEQKTSKQVGETILASNGVFIEALATQQINPINDSMNVLFSIINRNGFDIYNGKIYCLGNEFLIANVPANSTVTVAGKILPTEFNVTNPYWLNNEKLKGSFVVNIKNEIGQAESPAPMASFILNTAAGAITVLRPIQYKFTDPVKGEIYQPIEITYPAFINVSPSLILVDKNSKEKNFKFTYTLQANTNIVGNVKFYLNALGKRILIKDTLINLAKGSSITLNSSVDVSKFPVNENTIFGVQADIPNYKNKVSYSLSKISYVHIPDIFYHYYDYVNALKLDIKIDGKKAGYIAGAGDKVAEAMTQMGYEVIMLSESDISAGNLKQFDVIVTGVRAYNVHAWLSDKYDLLMNYVKEGGVLLNQYNTNNNIGPIIAKMSPYPFTISRNRVTDENAEVKFLLPTNRIMTYPNVITKDDFKDWIQERSTYEGTNVDSHYEQLFSMKDLGEEETKGSLLVTDYGKGKYIYSSLVFFRELPAAVPGAFRLFANLLAKPKK